MRTLCLGFVLAVAIAVLASTGLAQKDASAGPYKVLKTAQVGGEGGFDYISADVANRLLVMPRNGAMGGVTVFNLDTLAPVGSIPSVQSGGATVDPISHHGFSTTKPAMTMWDSKTLQVIKTIPVEGRPDGIMYDAFNERVWVFSHAPPYATVIDGKEGTIAGTIDLGGQPEQAATDGKGTVYVNIMDKSDIAVVDAKSLTVTKHFDLSSKGVMSGSGLSLDAKNHILFSYWRSPEPQVVIVNAESGNIITTLPTDTGIDTVGFNPNTMEAIATAGAGSLIIIKENSRTSFEVEQKLKTMVGARNMVIDTKTNHVISNAFQYGPVPANAPPPVAGRSQLGPPIPGSFTLIMMGRQ